MNTEAEIVTTDFGKVVLSERTIKYLDGIDCGWRELLSSKVRRGKRADFARTRCQAVMDAILTIARIRWSEGKLLKKF